MEPILPHPSPRWSAVERALHASLVDEKLVLRPTNLGLRMRRPAAAVCTRCAGPSQRLLLPVLHPYAHPAIR